MVVIKKSTRGTVTNSAISTSMSLLSARIEAPGGPGGGGDYSQVISRTARLISRSSCSSMGRHSSRLNTNHILQNSMIFTIRRITLFIIFSLCVDSGISVGLAFWPASIIAPFLYRAKPQNGQI